MSARRMVLCVVAGMALIWAIPAGSAQMPLPEETKPAAPNLLKDPAANPGKVFLYDLEAKFAKDVLARGGAAFAEWFAEDGVALGNGAKPARGREAVAKSANWKPEQYQLIWTPTDAVMGPSGDMGFTWGHYEGHSKDANGNPVTVTGRYMTIWRKQPDGSWKVVLDAGASEPAAEGDCCRLPTGQ